jgi:phage repressor protein C with HTH and peptisase S24 domain
MTKIATKVATKVTKADTKAGIKTKQVYTKKQNISGNIYHHKSNKIKKKSDKNELHRTKKRNKKWMSETQGLDNNPTKLLPIPEEQMPTIITPKPTVETPPKLKKGNITFTKLKKSNFDDIFDDKTGFMFQKIHSLYEFDDTKIIKVF